WFLRRVEPRADLAAAWQAFEAFVLELMAAAETPFTALFEVTGEDRAEARELAADALERNDLALAIPASPPDPWREAATRAPPRVGRRVSAGATSSSGGSGRASRKPCP